MKLTCVLCAAERIASVGYGRDVWWVGRNERMELIIPRTTVISLEIWQCLLCDGKRRRCMHDDIITISWYPTPYLVLIRITASDG